MSWTVAGIRSTATPTEGQATFVFSSATNVVVVNCRWPHIGPDKAALRAGCSQVLATLAVGYLFTRAKDPGRRVRAGIE